VLTVKVYRPDWGEVLEGQLNGRPIEPPEIQPPDDNGDTPPPPPDDGGDVVFYQNDWGNIMGLFPASWDEVRTDCVWTGDDGSGIGPCLVVSTDLSEWETTWNAPGVFIAASSAIVQTPAEFLDDFRLFGDSECSTYEGRLETPPVGIDGLYIGLADSWSGCGPPGASLMLMALLPPEASFLIVLQFIVGPADVDSVYLVLSSFGVFDATFPGE
jgi:hypothetical protein